MSKSIEELLADPEIALLITSFADKRVTQALQTSQLKRPDTTLLMQRLQRLENATHEAERTNKIKFFAYKKATENGVDYSLIENEAFVDENAVLKRISALATFAKKAASENLNNQILNSAFRPGSGNQKDSTVPKAAKNFDDYVQEFSTEK